MKVEEDRSLANCLSEHQTLLRFSSNALGYMPIRTRVAHHQATNQTSKPQS